VGDLHESTSQRTSICLHIPVFSTLLG
jgi:hypothetical protein